MATYNITSQNQLGNTGFSQVTGTYIKPPAAYQNPPAGYRAEQGNDWQWSFVPIKLNALSNTDVNAPVVPKGNAVDALNTLNKNPLASNTNYNPLVRSVLPEGNPTVDPVNEYIPTPGVKAKAEDVAKHLGVVGALGVAGTATYPAWAADVAPADLALPPATTPPGAVAPAPTAPATGTTAAEVTAGTGTGTAAVVAPKVADAVKTALPGTSGNTTTPTTGTTLVDTGNPLTQFIDWIKKPENAAQLLSGAGGIYGSISGGHELADAITKATEAQTAAYEKGTKAQQDAADKALAFLREQSTQQQTNAQPWLNQGKTALSGLNDINNAPAWKYDPNEDPGTQFRLKEGLKAVQASAAARGGMFSGQMLKNINDYGQQAGSQEFNNASNRAFNERGQKINSLLGQAGLGGSASANLNSASSNTANTGSNLLTTQGNNLYQGYTGVGNLQGNSITGRANADVAGNLGGWNTGNNLLSSILNRQQSQGIYNKLGGG